MGVDGLVTGNTSCANICQVGGAVVFLHPGVLFDCDFQRTTGIYSTRYPLANYCYIKVRSEPMAWQQQNSSGYSSNRGISGWQQW